MRIESSDRSHERFEVSPADSSEPNATDKYATGNEQPRLQVSTADLSEPNAADRYATGNEQPRLPVVGEQPFEPEDSAQRSSTASDQSFPIQSVSRDTEVTGEAPGSSGIPRVDAPLNPATPVYMEQFRERVAAVAAPGPADSPLPTRPGVSEDHAPADNPPSADPEIAMARAAAESKEPWKAVIGKAYKGVVIGDTAIQTYENIPEVKALLGFAVNKAADLLNTAHDVFRHFL